MLQSCDILRGSYWVIPHNICCLFGRVISFRVLNMLVGVLYWCVCCDAFEWHSMGVIVIHPDTIIHRTALNIYSMWENIAIMLFCV